MQCAEMMMVATSSKMQDKLCLQHTEDDDDNVPAEQW